MLGFGALGLGLRIRGLGLRDEGLGLRVKDLGFRVLRFRVLGLWVDKATLERLPASGPQWTPKAPIVCMWVPIFYYGYV